MKEYPFQADVFTAEVSSHEMPVGADRYEYTPFVLDLLSTTFPRNPCVVDYDHDPNQPVGGATLTATENSIQAVGKFVSAIDGDRAFQLGETSAGTPFGISPTLDLNNADIELIGEGEEGTANGRTYQGPLAIYRGARLLGFAVCPIPTDANTFLTVLERDGLIQLKRTGLTLMSTELENDKEPIPTDQNNQETQGDETGVSIDDAPPIRDAELQGFIDEFGLERGVGFFQRNLSLDDARMEDYGELKKARLSDCCEKGEEPAKKEEEKPVGLSAIFEKVEAFGRKIDGMYALLSKGGFRIGEKEAPRARIIPKEAKPTYLDSVRDAARR